MNYVISNTVRTRILITYLYAETMLCRLLQDSVNYVQSKKRKTVQPKGP